MAQQDSPYNVYTPGVRRDRGELVPVQTTMVQYLTPEERERQMRDYEIQPYKVKGLPRYNITYASNGLPPKDSGPPKSLADEFQILMNIPAVGQHRFLFGLNKYPGVVAIMLGAWLLWGRGKSNSENNWYVEALGIVSLIMGIYIVLTWFYGQLNHGNQINKARKQTLVRMVHLGGNIILTIIKLVFAILVIVDYREGDETTSRATNPPGLLAASPGTTTTTIKPYTNDEIVVIAAILLGMAILVLLFSMISISFGAYAMHRLEKSKRRLKQQMRGRDNRGAQF